MVGANWLVQWSKCRLDIAWSGELQYRPLNSSGHIFWERHETGERGSKPGVRQGSS
jgi:hypothetical protein